MVDPRIIVLFICKAGATQAALHVVDRASGSVANSSWA